MGIVPFKFEKIAVRVEMIGDEPWFVAKDVCDALGLGNITKAVSSLDDDELTLLKVRTGGQDREMNVINESGLYSLILRSNKPQAKKFKKWVTSEVLPSIRRHGHYNVVSETQIDELVSKLVKRAMMGISFTPNKRRVGMPLSGEEKAIIDDLYAEYWSLAAIAREIGCDIKTISRYINAKMQTQPINLLAYTDEE